MFVFLSQITNWIIAFTGTFGIWLIICIFLLFAINEFGVFIPCLIETVWLMIGYHAVNGSLSVFQVILVWIIAMLGRLIGVLLFISLIRLSSPWIKKLYRRHFNADLSEKIKTRNFLPLKIFRRIDIVSPYVIAFGRLIGLKIPFSITLSLQRRVKNLILALVLASVIHDSIYIVAGVIGNTIKLPSSLAIVYSILALAIIYGLSFLVRLLFRAAETKKLS
jgi:hypothetical protein